VGAKQLRVALQNAKGKKTTKIREKRKIEVGIIGQINKSQTIE